MATLPQARQTQSVFSQSLSPDSTLQIGTAIAKPNVITASHRDPAMAHILNSVKKKLVSDPNVTTKRTDTNFEIGLDVDKNAMDYTVQDTALSIAEAQNQLDALPNLGLTTDIIISSVLSPNDMLSTELIYSNESDLFGELEAPLTEVIRSHFDGEYDMTSKVGAWLEKALIVEGACALAVVPESAIDHAINSNLKITHEHLSTEFDASGEPIAIGNLSTPRYRKKVKSAEIANSLSLESFSVDADVSYDPKVGVNNDKWDFRVSVTDNPNLLKKPLINSKIRQDRLSQTNLNRGFGIESFRQDLFRKVPGQDIYPERMVNAKPVLDLKSLNDLDASTIGHPVVFEFPTEAVIPVYSPADPSNHVCYFLAVDENGNPVRMDQNYDQFRAMEKNFNNAVNGSAASSIMSSANAMGMAGGEATTRENASFAEMAKLYSQVIEQDLVQRMDGGAFYGKGLSIGKATELYKLMFVRALAKMNTQLVFIPKEYVTYIAFEYKSNGVGKSLLDKTKILGGLRMVEVMTSAIANAKSSIDHREINIELDADDPDPMKRVTEYLHQFQRATKAAFPMGVNSFADITDYLQKAGVQVKVTGHEGMPTMGMEVNNRQMNYTKPDDGYRDKLDKEHTMALGAPPEIVRSAEDIQFAANIISGHIYFAKISTRRQVLFSIKLSDHARKYTCNSEILMRRLTQIIKVNRSKLTKIDERYSDQAVAILFANNITISLPKPDMAQNSVQLEALEKYISILDAVLPSFVSDELFADLNLGEKMGQAISHVISILRAHFIRKWLSDNNVLPELFEMVNESTDAEERFGFLSNHAKRTDELAPAIRDYLVKAIARGAFSDGVITKAEELTDSELNEAEPSTSQDDYGSDTNDDGLDDPMDTGEEADADDLGGDDDFAL